MLQFTLPDSKLGGMGAPRLGRLPVVCVWEFQRGGRNAGFPVSLTQASSTLDGVQWRGRGSETAKWRGGIELDFRRKFQTWRRVFLVLASQAPSGGISVVIGVRV